MPTTFNNVWAALVLLAALLAAGTLGYSLADGQRRAEHADYLRVQAQAQAAREAQHSADLAAAYEAGDQQAAALRAANIRADDLAEQLKHQVPHVSTVYIEKPGAAPRPLPDRPFTVGWVRNYNAALGLSGREALRDPADAARASPGPSAPGPVSAADLARSAVTQADVLENHTGNSLACVKVTNQLNAILDLYEGRHD